MPRFLVERSFPTGLQIPMTEDGAAAIGNAIRDAVGVRLTEIPMTAQKLHRALTSANSTP